MSGQQYYYTISEHELEKIIQKAMKRAILEANQEMINQRYEERAARAVTIDTAQRILSCSRSKIYYLRKMGKLQSVLIGQTVMITKKSIEALQKPKP